MNDTSERNDDALEMVMRAVAFCAVWMLGCSSLSGDAGSNPVASAAPQGPVDRVELLGDVQHLLGEAVAASSARKRGEAERRWLAAIELYDEHLAPTIRDNDPEASLALEYALGQMGAALGGKGARPTRLFKPLDTRLADLRPLFVAQRDAARAAEAPGEP